MENLNYGVIGNCRSAALISDKGSIEWCCLPDFDSPSMFAKLLDRRKGGEFSIEPDEDYQITQKYLEHTNILLTHFRKDHDAFDVIDFMPRYRVEEGTGYYHAPEIYRYIRHISGKPKVRFRYEPGLNYAAHPTQTAIYKGAAKSITKGSDYESLYLYSDLNLEAVINRDEIEITRNHFFLISYNQKLIPINLERAYLEYQRTKVYWLNWVNRLKSFPSPYNHHLIRSALVLKLLTYQKTGAILAAITTSLPENIGDVRNWDYRFCWIRDASMIIQTFEILGIYKSAQRFLNFIVHVIPEKDEKIQIMYGIRGEKKIKERFLDHLEGYLGSKPVRTGNAAYMQKQNDIYGILADVIYQSFKLFPATLENSEELWTIVRKIVHHVRNNWKKPDRGIWELRTKPEHFVFSKLLCWTAVDRSVRIAELLDKKTYVRNWSNLRDKIRNDMMKKGWNPNIGAFTQYYGSPHLDAANLLMEHFGFIEASDEKYVSTVKKTKETLCRDGLMYRYINEDDFGKPETSFTICTFWMIDSLFKIGRKEEARQMFEKLLAYGNHLGLFSEGISFENKRLLGNFPQGYSHLALIQTAILLCDECMEKTDEFEFIKP